MFGDRPVMGLGFRVLRFRVRVMGQGPVMGRDGQKTGDESVMDRMIGDWPVMDRMGR
jgi:hypothetical protein